MAPLLAAFLGALALGGVVVVASEVKKKAPLDPSKLPLVDPVNQPGLVNALDKGRTYAVLAMNDWTKMPGAIAPGGGGYQTPDRDGNSRYIKAIFEGLGFKVLSDPQVKDPAEAKKFFAGQPSLWVFNAQWTKDEKAVDLAPVLRPIFPTTAFYLLPTA
jgi:hypothetical protein